jgi:glycosyltransferase involved in cell wall biosynthesis
LTDINCLFTWDSYRWLFQIVDDAMDETPRRPRLAFLLLRGLDHFANDLIAGLPDATGWEVRPFHITGPADLDNALDWANCPDLDTLWFEFCWPPFPQLIATTDFGGRRVIVRVHRIEAMETPYVAQTPWHKVQDVIVVSSDMAARVRRAAPNLERTTRLHLVHNGLNPVRFGSLQTWNRFRIGWCGLMTLRKNPTLALQVLFALRAIEPRYHLHICSNGGEALATESFFHLVHRLDLRDAVHVDGTLHQQAMPSWHACNGVLLHTSLHESFGYAIAEAAATGCDLAVLDHPGAAEFWPDAIRYGTVEEAARLICDAAPYRWRDHVTQNFSLARQIVAAATVLRSQTPL